MKLRSLEGQGEAESLAWGFDVERGKNRATVDGADRPGAAPQHSMGTLGLSCQRRKPGIKSWDWEQSGCPRPLPVYSSFTSSSGASCLSITGKFAQPDAFFLQGLQLTETAPLHRTYFLPQNMALYNANCDSKGRALKGTLSQCLSSPGKCLGWIHFCDPRVGIGECVIQNEWI